MRQRIYVHILFTLRLSADLYTVESLQISVNGPGGELPIVDRLHRRLRHPRQVAAAEDTRLTGVRRPRGQFLIFSLKGTVSWNRWFFPKNLLTFGKQLYKVLLKRFPAMLCFPGDGSLKGDLPNDTTFTPP